MKVFKGELDGAWEERGVIGSRVEIDGNRFTYLWRNSPVLETKFRTVKSGDATELILAKKGLRYSGSASEYAEITAVSYSDGRLDITEYFPITGESRTTLTRTENSRYGNYEVVDEVLKELEGTWKGDDGIFELTFRGDRMTLNGHDTRVHVLRSKSQGTAPNDYIIADADPSVYEWRDFARFEYDGASICGRMIVYDAPAPYTVTFHKTR